MKRAPLLGSLIIAVFASFVIGCFSTDGPLEWRDTVPPGQVINLTVVEAAGNSVVLTWSAPGGDGDSGRAAGYEVRYAPLSTSEFVWAEAAPALELPYALNAGMTEKATVNGLPSAGPYRFALRAFDQDGNWSAVSNIVDEYFVAIIPDTVVAEYLRQLTGNDSLPIHVQDLAGLVTVWIADEPFADLRGLEHCTNLRTLYLRGGPVSQLGPLSRLTNLESAAFYRTNVKDLTPLAGLTRLAHLDVVHGEVEDISVVAGLTNLMTLTLPYNSITDLSPLAGLSRLNTLYIPYNDYSDISPLAGLTGLRVLQLADDSIPDLSALQNLTNLIWLDITSCRVTDLTPLVDNPGLDSGDVIWMSGNPLSDDALHQQIPALEARGIEIQH